MAFPNLQIAGNETISIQTDNYHKKLTSIIEEYRSVKESKTEKDEEAFFKTVSDSLTKRFGLTVEFGLLGVLFLKNAWAEINIYVRTNPLYDDFRIKLFRNSELIGKKDIITANIDLKKAYISGSITKYKNKITVTKALFNDSKITSAEISAVILHEMGHLFTFVEYLLYATKINTVILTRTQDILSIPNSDPDKRIAIIEKDADLKKLPSIYKEDLTVATKEDSVATIIYKGMIEEVNAFAGMDYYSNRYAEQAADLFSIRNGASIEISTFLKKLGSRNPSKTNILIDNVLATIFTLGLAPILNTLSLIFLSDPKDLYDDPQQRVNFIKQEYINRLKEVSDPEERKLLLSAINELKKISDWSRKAPNSLYHYIAYATSSRYRSRVDSINRIKEIEALIDNDLYVSGNNLAGI